MKLRTAILVFGLIIISISDVYGTDWKLFCVDNESFRYYDTQSITRPSTNVVRVWVRSDYMKNMAAFSLGLEKKYEISSSSKALFEINCTEKMIHSLSKVDYDNKGGVIDSISSPSEWGFIVPDSIGENLYKEVCK